MRGMILTLGTLTHAGPPPPPPPPLAQHYENPPSFTTRLRKIQVLGMVLKQPELADSLELLAEQGPSAFCEQRSLLCLSPCFARHVLGLPCCKCCNPMLNYGSYSAALAPPGTAFHLFLHVTSTN